MAHHIGAIETFDETVENWCSYVERLENYFAANRVEDDKKVPTMLSLIGSRTYGLLRSLVAPTKPSTKSYADLCKTLKDHLSPPRWR